jgi:hypothetical protein
MPFRRLVFVIIGLAGIVSAQDSLPLPKPNAPPVRGVPGGLLKPSMVVRPPVVGDPAGPEALPQDARAQALLEMEKKLIQEQSRKQVADEAKKGSASALKQLIVMLGPVDEKLGRSPKPPVTFKDQIALIGLDEGKVASKSLDQFFGTPLTPELQAKLLDSVKTQMAGKDMAKVEVTVAGWWPEEGVMAVSVVPKS